MIEIEVRLADGAFYRAFVTAVHPDRLLVAFDNEFVDHSQLFGGKSATLGHPTFLRICSKPKNDYTFISCCQNRFNLKNQCS